jgi:glycosyltransferase involved in cell wall biosynthesis
MGEATAMKVLLWGTYDTGKPRTRILMAALRAAGADVTEVRKDVWSGVEDKSQLNRGQRAVRLLRWAASYPRLLLRFMTAPRPDVVLLAYPAHMDALVLRTAARLRRVPVAMDLFMSLYDTTVIDRALVGPGSVRARLLRSLEWLAVRAADRVFIDTAPHARYVEELFGLSRERVGDVPVGAELAMFELRPRPTLQDRPRILFYGQLIPLHGIGTVLDAAMSLRGAAFDWVIIGSGQETGTVEAALGRMPPPHITWKRWVPYSELADEIEAASVCLGIFGSSRKAASVVPNKVYQCLACGRHVVTRESPAMRQLADEDEPGVTLVAAKSADALLDGIEAAVGNGCAPPSAEVRERFSLEEIGRKVLAEIAVAGS